MLLLCLLQKPLRPPPPEAGGRLEGRPSLSCGPRLFLTVSCEGLVREDWARGRDGRRVEGHTATAPLVGRSVDCVG